MHNSKVAYMYIIFVVMCQTFTCYMQVLFKKVLKFLSGNLLFIWENVATVPTATLLCEYRK